MSRSLKILDLLSAEMWKPMTVGLVVFLLLGVLDFGKAEIYIVTIEGEPVISYKGGVNGFEATALEDDEKLDVARYCCFHIYFPFL